ncbi:MAG: lactate utilization protein [Anaerolineaceae bacterium]|nr:lactate utilization protein [Anaerolineaceae bacterium]MDE0328716.1 lactate utilization protein [Anaerolineaceae bacterium]
MSEAREQILGRLRDARDGLPDAPAAPERYQPVSVLDDESAEGLLSRFRTELEGLQGEVYVVPDEEAALDQVLTLLAESGARHALTWDWPHIPLPGLAHALGEVGIDTLQATPDNREACEAAEAGISGADAAIAATGSLVVSTAPGMGRLATLLPPQHIVLLRQERLLPSLEAWVAQQRADDLAHLGTRSNLCIITGPSRTADIEKNLVLGVHGPGRLQVVVVEGES